MPDHHRSLSAGRRSILLPVLLMVLLLAAIFAIGIKTGAPAMTWRELYMILTAGGGDELARVVVLEIRLPRILLALLVGAMLGTAGTMLQGGMNNQLAGPELLGVSSGASLGMAVITVLHIPIPFELHPVIALLGGLLGGFMVILAARGSRGIVGMLMIGMSVSAILSGLLIILIAMGTSNDVQLLYTYLLGSLANRTWDHVIRILPWAVVALPIAFTFASKLNLLQLGDDAASGLGVKAERTRILILIVSTLLVAITVAQCGPIGYIALLAPHVTRIALHTLDTRLVLPFSALCGGILLAAADTVARLLLYPVEIPVGIWTTLLGGSLFLFFLLKRRGGGQRV
ncbi:Hemin transport system permease protein HmuU [Paenibacillus plantiphilus]|uniref:Hemin transport system permease protein HmuU n=1 Tax=Paenibacillus plantiphilus TaxID=2905650 RepID=A0ABN8G4B7_9BACL|nr:iron ABC transporter permease [Paenibacillus plantiphilus]CAH1199198.1 Hemin transport system permease protein HmuU [Paenibacillus plantiphilus]